MTAVLLLMVCLANVGVLTCALYLICGEKPERTGRGLRCVAFEEDTES